MAPMGIEYEVVDLEGDLDGGPVELRRHVPDEIAMLSGGLFEKLPKQDVPLDAFFPPEYKGSPTWHRTRSDSLVPVAAEPAPESIAQRPVSPAWYVGMAAAVMIGVLTGTLVQRPSSPATAAQPTAPVKAPVAPIEARSPVVEAPKAEKPAAKPDSGTKRILSGTSPIVAARVLPVAPAAETTEKASGTEPVIENMPVAPPPPPKAPEVPAQQSTSVSVASAARGAASCLPADDLRRTMAVGVTFAPSGRVTQAIIEGGPHRGTAIGSCIAQHLRSASIKPFEGPPITVHTSIHLR